MEVFWLAAEAGDAGLRIDSFLGERLSDMSRSAAKRLLTEGLVTVNQHAVKPNYLLRMGDMLRVEMPDPVEVDILPEDIPLSVVYEDRELVVVDKPQGMVVHPAPGHSSGTLVNALLFHCKGELSGLNGEIRPGIVHRIDKDTSGLLVVAKTNAAHQGLAEQWATHSITRKYTAVVYNGFSAEAGTIDAPIGRHPQDRKRMAVTQKNSRRAVTHYRVLEKLGRFQKIEATLETGRTHQIRVHMAYIGHPLLGDTVYGPAKQPFSLAGQVLHAGVLGFLHPVTKEYMEFTAPPPPYFFALLQKLRGNA